jgi:hypothetical protein
VATLVASNQVNLAWGSSTDDVAVTGYLVERSQGVNCTGFVQIATLPATGISGPLTVSSLNPRYFVDPNGKTRLLGGSHHWVNLIDTGTVSPPPVFDYDAYLAFLSTNHHNFFRLWAQGLPKMNYTIQNAGPWYQSPQPWLRTGPGNATDGLLKFDLSQINQAYFDRLRLRVQKANARGIYVSIMLFDGYHIQFDRRSDDGYPLSGANNINGVDDGGGTRSEDFSVIPGTVLAVEENYARKVIDTVNDLPNVLYEIANEAGSYSTGWQQHFIALVKTYEAGKPFQHPVGFTFQYSGGSDSALYASSADWVSPAERFPSNDSSRHVLLNDTDHSYFWTAMKSDGAQLNRAFVWKNFTAGNSAKFMDPYLMPWSIGGNVRNNPGGCGAGPSCTTVDPAWNPIRQNIGYMLDYANSKLDLAKMTPHGNLASTGNCLANAAPAGAEYLIYAPSSGSFTVNLSGTTRSLTVEWLNPSTGAVSSGGTVSGGLSAQTFTPPFSGDAVLYLVDAQGHATQSEVAYTDTDMTGGPGYCYRVRTTDAAGNLSPYSPVASVTMEAQAPNPPQITSIAFQEPGAVQVTVGGDAGIGYALEASSDLLGWTQVDLQTNITGSLVFTEQRTTNSAQFYRVVRISP